MPMFGMPVVASRREPVRTIRLPEGVKLAIIDMIELGDDFIAAGKRRGVKAQVMRRWLGRAECIAFLRRERARFRQTVCAQNEVILAEIRDDREGNQMARVRAVQVLEQLDETPAHRSGELPTPGVTIRIVNVVPQPAPIDVTPQVAVSSHGLPNWDE